MRRATFVLARHSDLIEAASKRGADLDRLDFYEIASRNPGSFDLRLDEKARGLEYIRGGGPRRFLQAAARRHAPAARRVRRRRRERAGRDRSKTPCRRPAVLGRFYTVFVPLVDVPQDGDGTAFWPGSHASPAKLRAAAAFNAARFEELPPDFELVAPGVARGSLLAFDYRVLHAGNPCARAGPWPISVNTRDDAVDDAWNWAPERLPAARGVTLWLLIWSIGLGLFCCGARAGDTARRRFVGGGRGPRISNSVLPSGLITHTN